MQSFLGHLRIWVWLVFWGCGSCLAATNTSQDDATPSFAGWLDHTGTATVDSVQQLATWEPFTGWKGWSFGPEPVWLRVEVPAASAKQASPYILIVRPTFLDHVTFYDPDTRVVRQAGDFLPPTDDALGSVLFTFEVPALAAARHVYVKIQSTSTRVVHLSLMPRQAAQSYTRGVEWATGCVWILSIVFLVWSLVQWLRTRDRVMGFFALKQLLIALWGFFLLGFARVTVGAWFENGVLSLISSMVVAGTVSTIFWFFAALLVEYKPRPWMLAMLRVGAWATVMVGLLNFVGHTLLSLHIINVFVPLALFWLALTLLTAKPGDARPPIAKAVLFGYVCLYVALNALPAMTHLGWIKESPILFVGNMSALVIDGLVMLVILNVRQHRFQVQHQTIATQLMLQQEQTRMDQQYLDEQRKLLAMLAHEMKTPLANLRIWMEAGTKGRPAMERAIHDMNRVIERCVHSGQLSDHSLQPHNAWFDAAELTQSVLDASRQPKRVEMLLPAEVCELHADAQMLSIVLSNVLENAYKYSAPDTPIVLQLEASTGAQGVAGWRWRVENALGAAGLPDADKVFEKYYRSPQAQRQSGSGLGLFLVKSLLDLMRGQVACMPMQDRVRFEVWLPRDGSEPQAQG